MTGSGSEHAQVGKEKRHSGRQGTEPRLNRTTEIDFSGTDEQGSSPITKTYIPGGGRHEAPKNVFTRRSFSAQFPKDKRQYRSPERGPSGGFQKDYGGETKDISQPPKDSGTR